jgi:hypothetical protein
VVFNGFKLSSETHFLEALTFILLEWLFRFLHMVYEINGNFVEITWRICSHVLQKFWICGNHRLIAQDKKDTLI